MTRVLTRYDLDSPAGIALEFARELCEWRRTDLKDGCPERGIWAGRRDLSGLDLLATSKGIRVQVPSERALDERVAWHAFWEPRGYRNVPLDLPGRPADAVPGGMPPRPRTEYGQDVSFTWKQLTRMHVEQSAGDQLTLDVGVAV